MGLLLICIIIGQEEFNLKNRTFPHKKIRLLNGNEIGAGCRVKRQRRIAMDMFSDKQF